MSVVEEERLAAWVWRTRVSPSELPDLSGPLCWPTSLTIQNQHLRRRLCIQPQLNLQSPIQHRLLHSHLMLFRQQHRCPPPLLQRHRLRRVWGSRLHKRKLTLHPGTRLVWATSGDLHQPRGLNFLSASSCRTAYESICMGHPSPTSARSWRHSRVVAATMRQMPESSCSVKHTSTEAMTVCRLSLIH